VRDSEGSGFQFWEKEVVFSFGRKKLTLTEGRWKIFDKEGERESFGRWRESEFWKLFHTFVMCAKMKNVSALF